jgi:aminopeptidase N
MTEVERFLDYFVPEEYDLELATDKHAREVRGTADIRGEAKSSTIKLHAKGLKIHSVALRGDPKDPKNSNLEWGDCEDGIAISGVPIGKIRLVVNWEFALNNQMHGAYLSTYHADGEPQTIVTTQFESHFARQCFPCVDEPAAKAVFSLTIAVPDAGDTVLSNMPEADEPPTHDRAEYAEGWKQVAFEPTPRMSTYLLAFVVGDFQKKSAKTKGGTEVSIYATKAQPADSLDFGLDIATRALDFYEEYFGVVYPLLKSDHVALPDFDAGAMENWGLVTYREACLLADPKLTPIDAKQDSANTIAHELAHMWFGDLVTMKWWDDLWLNESFATIMSYVCINVLEPGWNVWQDFNTSYAVASLRRDVYDGVQAVHQHVSHPDEIQSLFDSSIVYGKGARLMNMLMHTIGEEAFRAGLKSYFERYQYGNTVGADLWRELDQQTDFDVPGFMDQWVNRPGYPVVDVRLEKGRITLSQHRFALGDAPNLTWAIPLNSNLGYLPAILDQPELVVENDAITLATEIVLNVGGAGQFITNYDARSLDNLLAGLDTSDAAACLRLMTEQALLTKARQIDTAQLMKVIGKLAESDDYSVWDTICVALGDMKWFAPLGSDEEKALKKFAGELAHPKYQRLGWLAQDGEPVADTKLRTTVISLLTYAENSDVVEKALAEYAAAKSIDSLDSELRGLIVAAKVRFDETPELIDDLVRVYRTTSSSDVRDDVGSALSGTKNLDTIKRLMVAVEDRRTVRLQDAAHWAFRLLRNRYGTDEVWGYFRAKWDLFVLMVGGEDLVSDYPRYIASALSTEQQLQEYQEFFAPKQSSPALGRNIEVGEREITERIQLIASEAPKLRKFLLG